MSDSTQDSLAFVLQNLARRMIQARKRNLKPKRKPGATRKKQKDREQPEPGIVIVLGAGCSMQYGLPSFAELLQYAYEDLNLQEPLDPSSSLGSLRDSLDPHWQVTKPDELRHYLKQYLERIRGEWCTGYRHLAQLAHDGYIKAIVNMNFDTLFEEALQATSSTQPEVTRSFSVPANNGTFSLIKPHGSLRRKHGVPVLDLARSDLFDSKGETDAANELFRLNDIVFLGYSGADAKIAAALRPEHVPSDKEEVETADYNKIYVFNTARPDPRLLKILVDRQSTGLTVIGPEAAFENVLVELSRSIQDLEAQPSEPWKRADPKTLCRSRSERSDSSPPRKSGRGQTLPLSLFLHFAAHEQEALAHCRQLANNLRSRLNIAEGGQISIERHTSDLFSLCLRLARSAGNGLTTHEKLLLYCTAYFHDLGYFWAHSSSRKRQKYGWQLLTTHGQDTKTLLRKLPQSELDRITPRSLRKKLESSRNS